MSFPFHGSSMRGHNTPDDSRPGPGRRPGSPTNGLGVSAHPFPIEALRDQYWTQFGGRSRELRPGEVGVNADALRANTHLEAQSTVLVSPSPAPPVALVARPLFRVVALDEGHPYSLGLSKNGEAVFSAFEYGGPRPSPIEELRAGDAVVLNAAIQRLLGRSPSNLSSSGS
jgi:hypothetical protein